MPSATASPQPERHTPVTSSCGLPNPGIFTFVAEPAALNVDPYRTRYRRWASSAPGIGSRNEVPSWAPAAIATRRTVLPSPSGTTLVCAGCARPQLRNQPGAKPSVAEFGYRGAAGAAAGAGT